MCQEPYSDLWQKKNQGNPMAVASMIMGILSIITACGCFPGLICGGLAVLFAALSRVETRMRGKAVAGLLTGIAGIFLSAVSIIFWIYIMG